MSDREDELDTLLNELPPAPDVFAPRGLLFATGVVQFLLERAPGMIELPLHESTASATARALHASARRSNTSGPLIPRHAPSQSAGLVPKFRTILAERSDGWCKLVTRFDSVRDVSTIRSLLGVPDVFRTSRRERFTGDDALAILLSRLSYPGRLKDLEARWGRSAASISRCVTELGDFIFQRWKHLFGFRAEFHTAERLSRYTACITAAGSPLDDVWGFIDATIIEICRPEDSQETTYNGYKKHHALKFQAAIPPDGLIGPIFGPVEGRRADGGILVMSELEDACRQFARGTAGQQLFLYGDPAYGVSDTIVSSIRNLDGQSKPERRFNSEMSKVRQSVEWGFGNVANNFSYIDYDKGLRLGLQPVGQLYLLCVLFTNLRTILYSSQASHKFQCPPPTLEEYLTLPKTM